MKKYIKTAKNIIKYIAFNYTKYGAPIYPYNVEPFQLATLVNEIERLKYIPGNVLEVGVARGMTSLFLAHHIENQKLEEGLTYYALDTFNSFSKGDLEFEVKNRGKSLHELRAFEYNNFEVWASNFKKFNFVCPVKADCSTFDYSSIGPIKLSFLDVDLYLPTKKALPLIYDATISGGVILVDDVCPDKIYDGAHQAYFEFCLEFGLEPQVIGNRCGVVRKP